MRRVSGIVAAVVLAAAAALAGIAVTGRPRPATTASEASTATAPVTRGTVTERVRIAGTLGFDGAYSVVNLGRVGVLTAASEPGTIVARGGTLYTVDNWPVRLLFGTLPAYRSFAAGMPDGPDVRQLEENLAALRLNPGRVDARFTADTAAAIRRWQASLGLPADRRTGELARGDVVFLPGAVRVTAALVVPGTAVAANEPVLSATSTTRVVAAQLTTDRQHLVRVGDTVQVSLPGIAPLPGTVERVGRAATVPSPSDGRDGEPATVPVTISVALPAGGPEFDQAPVQVAITTATRENVLMVPVAALLARPGGGYQVRLASGGYVEVRPGLFDETAGTVEVTGELTDGDQVEVPAP